MPVKDDNGEVVFLACEGRDITEKKACSPRAASLEAENARREADRRKDEFLATLSHEGAPPPSRRPNELRPAASGH